MRNTDNSLRTCYKLGDDVEWSLGLNIGDETPYSVVNEDGTNLLWSYRADPCQQKWKETKPQRTKRLFCKALDNTMTTTNCLCAKKKKRFLIDASTSACLMETLCRIPISYCEYTKVVTTLVHLDCSRHWMPTVDIGKLGLKIATCTWYFSCSMTFTGILVCFCSRKRP